MSSTLACSAALSEPAHQAKDCITAGQGEPKGQTGLLLNLQIKTEVVDQEVDGNVSLVKEPALHLYHLHILSHAGRRRGLAGARHGNVTAHGATDQV